MKRINIFIAGHSGMVGSSLVRLLKKKNVNIIVKTKKELNLLNQSDVYNFFKKKNIDQVYLAAAKVGGIEDNIKFPGQFLFENLNIQNNIIHGAYIGGVKKVLFIASSTIYKNRSKNPIKETDLLSGPLEKSTEPYAIAKIAGIKMCETYNLQYKKNSIEFKSIVPTNMYGPGDNYSKKGHVIPSLIKKIYDAKVNCHSQVLLLGTGLAKREFLYVDDFANACYRLMNTKKKSTTNNSNFINVGSGEVVQIKKLAKMIQEIIEYKGIVKFNNKINSSVDRKMLDSTLIRKLNWRPKIFLNKGLKITINRFIREYKSSKKNFKSFF